MGLLVRFKEIVENYFIGTLYIQHLPASLPDTKRNTLQAYQEP
jgi:hypothetical protein